MISFNKSLFTELFNIIQQEVHINSKQKGFWNHLYLDCPACLQKEVIENPSIDAEKIALIHSENSEALERLRSDTPWQPDVHCPEFSNLEIEVADVIIRLLDFAEHKKLRIAQAMLAKHEYNKTRPPKHGKRF